MPSCLFRCWLVAAFVFALSATAPHQLCAADNPQGKEISEVVVVGNRLHTTKEILNLLQMEAGKRYDEMTVQKDTGRLNDTGWFLAEGIRVITHRESDGRVRVIVIVREVPRTVKEVVYEGADHLSKKELYALTGLRKGDAMNPFANELGRQALLSRYQDKGRCFATVELIEGTKPTDTRVVYRIVEGPLPKRIGGVEFVGNVNVSTDQLRILVSLKGKYPDNLVRDHAALKDYYTELGFPDAHITSDVRRIGDTNRVTIVYYITEGQRK